MISEAEWDSIFSEIEKRASKHGETLVMSTVIKSDPLNGNIWIPELGDQPIPIISFNYNIKYYDTDDAIGTIKMIAGVSIPNNYMLAVGTSLLRTSYPELFTEIGTRYGAADGTHFNLPDLRAKFVYGASAGDLSDVGTSGGEVNHTLTLAETPAHAHNIQLTLFHAGSLGAVDGSDRPARMWGGTPGASDFGATMDNQGGGGSHNNLPPYVRMAYVIKATGSIVTEKTAKISIAIPNKGDTVLVALERGSNRLPRCLGKLQGKNFIMTTGDDA